MTTENVPYGKKDLFFCYRFHSPISRPRDRVPGRILLVFIDEGELKLMVNGMEVDCRKGQMLFLHPHLELKLISESTNLRGRCIGFTMGLQDSAATNLGPTFFGTLIRNPVWDMDEEFACATSAFYDLFEYNCKHSASSLCADVAVSLFTSFLQLFREKMSEVVDMEEKTRSITSKSIMGRFANLLHTNYKEHHQVLFYADKMCISPKYLSFTVKEATGLTPKEHIDRKLAIESLYLLGKSELTIQEISFRLGFPDQSYFGRFFKRMFGISPMGYRLNPDLSIMSRLDLDFKAAAQKAE